MKQPNSRNAGFVVFENPKQLLSVKQVAEALGVKDHTVRKWVYTRQVEAVRLGGGVLRILAGSVNAFLSPAVTTKEMPKALKEICNGI